MEIRKALAGLSIASLLTFTACAQKEKPFSPTYQYDTPFQTFRSFTTSIKNNDQSQVDILIPTNAKRQIDLLSLDDIKNVQVQSIQEKKQKDALMYLKTKDPNLYPDALLDFFNIPKDPDFSKLRIMGLECYKPDDPDLGDSLIGVHIGLEDSLRIVKNNQGERTLPNYINTARGETSLPLPDFIMIKQNGIWRVWQGDENTYPRWSDQDMKNDPTKIGYTLEEFAYSPSHKLMAFTSTIDGWNQLYLSDADGKAYFRLRSITQDPRVQQGHMSNPVFIKGKKGIDTLQYYSAPTLEEAISKNSPPARYLKIAINEKEILKQIK